MTQVVGSIESVFSEHGKWLVEQALWTGMKVANNLKALGFHSEFRLQRKTAKRFVTFLNRRSVITVASSDGASSGKSGVRRVKSKGGGNRDSRVVLAQVMLSVPVVKRHVGCFVVLVILF